MTCRDCHRPLPLPAYLEGARFAMVCRSCEPGPSPAEVLREQEKRKARAARRNGEAPESAPRPKAGRGMTRAAARAALLRVSAGK